MCDDDPPTDLTVALASLPLVEVDPDKHFVKRGGTRARSGTCSSVKEAPVQACQCRLTHTIQPLGRSSNGELVLEKLNSSPDTSFWHCQNHRHLQPLDPAASLRAYDLFIRLGLFIAICASTICSSLQTLPTPLSAISRGDGEILWHLRFLFRQPVLDAVSTEKSDIYDLGQVIKGMRYGNAPMTNLVEWPVHPPLSGIVETCTRELPHERPNLEEQRIMVEGINAADSGKIRRALCECETIACPHFCKYISSASYIIEFFPLIYT